MILTGNNNGYWGDCYNLKSIFNFFDTYNGTAETEMIDRVSIDNMEYIKLDGRKVSKEYFRALRAAEVGFNMVKNNGVWSVDKSSILSIGSLNTNDPGSYYSSNGHLHSFVRELFGKKLSYKENGKKERYVGEIHRGFLASDNDIDQAFWENKRSGTIFNAVVSTNGILFYNSTYKISINR